MTKSTEKLFEAVLTADHRKRKKEKRFADTKDIKKILESGVDINARLHGGWSILDYAIRFSCGNIVKLLIQHSDIDINANGNPNSRTPLMWASFKGREEIVKLLLIHPQININIQEAVEEGGRTALMLAIEEEHTKIAKALIEAKADLDLEDALGQTALMYAVHYNNLEVAKTLLAAGANQDIENNCGSTASRIAFKECRREMLEILGSEYY